jgi:rhomboid protease GluP
MPPPNRIPKARSSRPPNPIHPMSRESAPAEAYSPEQARRRREYSDWDPRSAPGTYLLLAVNCAVYLWMCHPRRRPKDPTEANLLHYGANQTWLVLHGQWYRLLTATFVHVGLLHLATNMWCLWNLGMLGEPLIGPFGMVAVYMITGIAGNLLSMASNVVLALSPPTTPASCFAGRRRRLRAPSSASPASSSCCSRTAACPFPGPSPAQLRRRVVQFAAINLVIGLSTMFVNVGIRIDNMAHIGGFLSGLALGVPLVPAHDRRPRALSPPPEGHLRRSLLPVSPLRLRHRQHAVTTVVRGRFYVVRKRYLESSAVVFNGERRTEN